MPSSSSSSSAPRPSSSSSSSSSTNSCGNCTWKRDPFTGTFINLTGCSGALCECSPPNSAEAFLGSERDALAAVSTRCKPITSLPSVSSTLARSAQISLPPNNARIRIADVNNPLNWYTYLWDVAGPWSIFQAINYGWMITFLRIPHGAGPSLPEVVPSLVPTDGPSTEGWSAIVELPELSGANQYCVTILEEFGWAKLQTAEWTVLFIKAPSP